MAETLSLYKLIILKMLEQVEYPLTNSQITEFILDKEYTNYFTVQQALSELDETGLVNVTTKRNNSLYHITDAGKNTLEFFGNKISDAILTDIHNYLEEHKIAIREALSTTADYFAGNNGEYVVRCRVREQDSNLIDLTFQVPSKKQAESACSHWAEKSQNIYATIMKELL